MTIFTRTLSRRRRYLLMPRSGEEYTAVVDDPSLDDELPFDGIGDPNSVSAAKEPSSFHAGADRTAYSAFHPETIREPLELLLTSPDGHGVERVRIDESTALVGRGRKADLRLPHPDVSRSHVLLRRAADRVVFADLCSRTGVKLNGQARTSGWLAPGDVLQLGPFSIRWPGEAPPDEDDPHSETHEQNHTSDSDPQPAAGSSLRLHCAGGPDSVGRQIPLNPLVTLIGRSRSCDLTLGSSTLARVQVVVLTVPDGVVAVDLERRGNFTVNGIRCNEATATAGDEVRVGPYRLTLADVTAPQNRPGSGTDRVLVPTGTPSDIRRAVAPHASPNDDAVRALVAALAELQRRFQERSRHQLELLPQLKESASVSLQNEIDAEIRRLQAIVGEDVYDTIRAELQNAALPAGPVVPTERQQREATLRRAFGPRPVHQAPVAVPVEPRQQPDLHEPAEHDGDPCEASVPHEPLHPEATAADGGAEYARIASRIANQRRGRASRTGVWGSVLRSIFLMG